MARCYNSSSQCFSVSSYPVPLPKAQASDPFLLTWWKWVGPPTLLEDAPSSSSSLILLRLDFNNRYKWQQKTHKRATEGITRWRETGRGRGEEVEGWGRGGVRQGVRTWRGEAGGEDVEGWGDGAGLQYSRSYVDQRDSGSWVRREHHQVISQANVTYSNSNRTTEIKRETQRQTRHSPTTDWLKN